MKWLKISIISIVIIIIIILVVLLKIRTKVEYKFDDLPPSLEISDEGTKVKPELINNNLYFSIDACSDKILSYSKANNNEAVFGLLTDEYILNNNIKVDNVFDITKLNTIKKYKTENIYIASRELYRKYYTKLKTDVGDIYLNINEDVSTGCFTFEVLTQSQFEEYISSENPIYSKEIEKNEYNAIPYKNLSEEDVVEKYLMDFIKSAIDYPEEAYNKLDKTYKGAKFTNLSEFNSYISNRSDIKRIYDEKVDLDNNSEDFNPYKRSRWVRNYLKENYDNYTKYVIEDVYNNYYIFFVTSTMQYTVILDTYTIDIPEFLEKYNTTTDQGRVILNINKFALALNYRDYKYAYSKLADSFKANNFPTLGSFETYIKSNFYANNKFEYKKFGSEGGTYYTYDVDITENVGTSTKTISKTFIMQLGEGTDFKLSFNK